MVFFAAIALLRVRGVRVRRIGLPGPWVRATQRGYRSAMARPPLVRSAAIGLLTTMLPCGWLYAFAVTAAGTGSPLAGACVMAVFWAGTLPMLVSLGVGLRGVLGPVGRRAPALTAVVLALTGIYTLVGRAALGPADLLARLRTTAPHRQTAGIVAVPTANAGELPCCKKP
jgi:sulfite exporter TauE/SafE